MTLARKKGDEFERRVKKLLESKGCFVIRQSASVFPDLIVMSKKDSEVFDDIILIECKCNKYIRKKERLKFEEFDLLKLNIKKVIAYKVKGKIFFCDLKYNIINIY
ncbi:MAG: hypothetical protein EOL97_14655 [Spirochaetia bacterium]|nr:hypothetical protein [Spirochaetia bacterium]